MYEAVLESQEVQLGPNHPSTLGTKNNLAGVMMNQGKVSEARALYEAVLEAKEVQLGPNHPSTLDTKTNLGVLFQTMAQAAEQNGERAEAADLYRMAADMWEPQYGKDDEDVVECRAKARELSA